MSSPVLHGGRLFGFSHRQKGQVVAVDAGTGTLLWAGPGRQRDNASLIMAGDDLLVLTTEGALIAARATAKAWTPVATYTVADTPPLAHLAVAPGLLVVKDERMVTLWRVK